MAPLKKMKLKQIFFEILVSFKIAFFIYFMDNLILIFNSLVPLIICVNVGDEKNEEFRLLRGLYLTCWTKDHSLFTIIFVIPLMIFFGACIPLFIIIKIYSAKKNGTFKSKTFLNQFAKFLLPYKEARAYYEVFLIFNKVIIVFLKEGLILMTVYGNLLVILMILFFYLIFYLIIHLISKPYQ